MRTNKLCRLKYVARAEKIEEVFAIKFYASRDRKSQYNKYSLAHGQLDVKAVFSIFDTCLWIMSEIIKAFPNSSFVFKASEAYDPHTRREEDEYENQRFRIYRSFLSKKVGTRLFTHYHFPENSIYLLVRKSDTEIDDDKKDRLMHMMKRRFGLL